MTASHHDVVVVGAGLAGTSTTCALVRDGYDVALIDTHAVYPPDFRAEKLGQPQMDLFDKFGLGPVVRRATTAVDHIWVSRFDRLVAEVASKEYGLHYTRLVNELRAALPAASPVIVGRVAGIETGPERQSVNLADGRIHTARLLVVATGLGDALRRKAGIGKVLVSQRHSLSFGFDLAAPPSAFPFPSLTYFGRFGTRVAYITIFPIGTTMRANLFVYRDLADPWVKAFRSEPERLLREALPGLAGLCGDIAVAGPVEMRPIDLVKAEGHRRDGVVLVGDAFLTPCPIPGTGIGKVLTDVDCLCTRHVPAWMATPGMAAAKIATYYDDPVKVESDTRSLRASLYARAINTRTGPAWTARRGRNFAGRHVLHVVDRARTMLRRARKPPLAPVESV